MTVSFHELLLYALGMAGLWAVPGPVWVALTARALSGGFAAAWPLAIGVTIGDLVWPLTAILGLSWIESAYGDLLSILRWVAAAIFLVMGFLLIRKPAAPLNADSRLTRPGIWAGLSVGVAAVIGNPKAILFYMGMLPGFFDLSRITGTDVLMICLVSMLVPLCCNVIMAWGLSHLRRRIGSQAGFGRINRIAGALLIAVGAVITQT